MFCTDKKYEFKGAVLARLKSAAAAAFLLAITAGVNAYAQPIIGGYTSLTASGQQKNVELLVRPELTVSFRTTVVYSREKKSASSWRILTAKATLPRGTKNSTKRKISRAAAKNGKSFSGSTYSCLISKLRKPKNGSAKRPACTFTK